MRALSLLTSLLVAYSSTISASESKTEFDKYISNSKNQQFSFDYKKVDLESSKLRDSWISPIRLQYSYNKSKPNSLEQIYQGASIKIDQPIFKSGGIYFGIKFAEASRRYSNFSVDLAKRKLIVDAISLLIQIKQSSLKIEKQKLQIENTDIKLEIKKEQYINGQLDSSFLDNAIIEKNIATQILFDIQTAREKMISRFKSISDNQYTNIEIPHLNILNKQQFLENNIVLNMANSKIQKDRYYKNMTITKYLPQINLVAGYNWDKSKIEQLNNSFIVDENDYKNYGFRASMPLDINSFRDIEVSKVEYLKSTEVLKDKERELSAIFEQVIQNIDNLNKKESLSVSNIELYDKLLSDTKKLYSVGYKTQFDVDLLANSLKIQKFSSKIFELDKQLELLTLYEMYNSK